ncbi:hypothetical protein BDV27DRAFT_119915, partial [Aspergillus caelatus]
MYNVRIVDTYYHRPKTYDERSEYPSFHTKARHDRPVRLMAFAILMTLVILLRVMII